MRESYIYSQGQFIKQLWSKVRQPIMFFFLKRGEVSKPAIRSFSLNNYIDKEIL